MRAGCRRRARLRDVELRDLARLKALNEEADRQRTIAAERVATSNTKASFLLVGAGIIAGSMGIDQKTSMPEGALALAALLSAIAAGIFAIVSLAPAPTLVLRIDTLEERVMDSGSDVQVHRLLLHTKSVAIAELTLENSRRTAWNLSGYIALSAAFLLALANWSTAIVEMGG